MPRICNELIATVVCRAHLFQNSIPIQSPFTISSHKYSRRHSNSRYPSRSQQPNVIHHSPSQNIIVSPPQQTSHQVTTSTQAPVDPLPPHCNPCHRSTRPAWSLNSPNGTNASSQDGRRKIRKFYWSMWVRVGCVISEIEEYIRDMTLSDSATRGNPLTFDSFRHCQTLSVGVFQEVVSVLGT
jgi:hypothetical protein